MLNPRGGFPDVEEAAQQVIEDIRADIDGTGPVDVISTVSALRLDENDLVALVVRLAARVVELEDRTPTGPA